MISFSEYISQLNEAGEASTKEISYKEAQEAFVNLIRNAIGKKDNMRGFELGYIVDQYIKNHKDFEFSFNNNGFSFKAKFSKDTKGDIKIKLYDIDYKGVSEKKEIKEFQVTGSWVHAITKELLPIYHKLCNLQVAGQSGTDRAFYGHGSQRSDI